MENEHSISWSERPFARVAILQSPLGNHPRSVSGRIREPPRANDTWVISGAWTDHWLDFYVTALTGLVSRSRPRRYRQISAMNSEL
jgi:hypothetical protein